MQWCLINPEEATNQNISHLDCNAFARSVFLELLNITLPYQSHMSLYINKNIGSPEIVAYSYINDKKIPEMIIYDPKAPNNYTIINPTFKKVLELLKVGDILANFHPLIILELIKNENGETIDAVCMHSTTGIIRVETKIGKEQSVLSTDGTNFGPYFSSIFYNGKINPQFDDDIKEATVQKVKLSEFSDYVNIGDINKRLEEYVIFRFINKDSNGNAILNYKTLYSQVSNAPKNNEIINLSDRSNDRRIFKRLP